MRAFYSHGSSIFMVCLFFVFFVFLVGTSKIAVLLAWEFNSGEPDRDFSVFFVIFGNAEKSRFRQPCFFMFFYYFFLCLLGGILALLWCSFGVSDLSLACWCRSFRCLWLAWAVCGLSLLLFLVPLARQGCLWARGWLRDRFSAPFLNHFGLIF